MQVMRLSASSSASYTHPVPLQLGLNPTPPSCSSFHGMMTSPRPLPSRGWQLAFRVPRRKRVVAEAVAVTDTSIATVNEQLGLFALGGATPRTDRVFLGAVV